MKSIIHQEVKQLPGKLVNTAFVVFATRALLLLLRPAVTGVFLVSLKEKIINTKSKEGTYR
jgi:hypothetical protein